MKESELTLKDIEDALNEVWEGNPYKIKMVTDNLVRACLGEGYGCLIMDRRAYEAKIADAVRKSFNSP